MKTWKQCCEEVGYDPYENNPPEKIMKYYVYKNGAVFHVKTLEEAKGISKNYEKVVCNQDEIDAYWNSRRDLENKAQAIWYNSLLEEYSYLPRIKKYIIVGFDGDESHHTCGVWSSKIKTCSANEVTEMRRYKQQRNLIELEINPSNGKVVAAKVVE